VQILVLISPFHIGKYNLQYSSGILWNFGVPIMEIHDMKVPDMEAFLSRQNEPIKINQQTLHLAIMVQKRLIPK
jgi:hypothetical protein